MHRHTRLILIILAATAIVGALLWTALRPVPVTADLATVTRGPMRVTVDVDGTTRIREVYDVASPIAGTAGRAPVRVGDRVVAGTVATDRPFTLQVTEIGENTALAGIQRLVQDA